MVSFRNGGGGGGNFPQGTIVLEPVLSIEFYLHTFPLLINILIKPPAKKISTRYLSNFGFVCFEIVKTPCVWMKVNHDILPSC